MPSFFLISAESFIYGTYLYINKSGFFPPGNNLCKISWNQLIEYHNLIWMTPLIAAYVAQGEVLQQGHPLSRYSSTGD